MPRTKKQLFDQSFLSAALEGLLLQKQRLDDQIRQVRSMMGKSASAIPSTPAAPAEKPARKRRLSAAARRTIALAQKKRWETFRKEKELKAKKEQKAKAAAN